MKKIIVIFLSAVMLVTSACASENEVNEGVAGESQKTYKEFVYTLPFLEEGDTIQDFCQLSDGKWAVWTSDNRLFTTPAGENEWTQTVYEESGWYEERGEKWIFTRLSPDGARISYCIDIERQDNENVFFGEQKIDYLYVSTEGNEVEGVYTAKEEEEYISDFYLSHSGEVICSGSNRVYSFEPKNAERKLLIETQVMAVPFFDGNVMMIPDINGMSFYDLEKGEQLPQNEVLDKFLKEKAANLNQGMIYVTADREGNLYFLLEDGFYRYLEDGSVVEQVFDANITEKGSMETYSCLDICIDGGEKFQMFYGDGSRRVYGTHIVREPDVILTLYRLQNEPDTDKDLEAAIKKYSEIHPEIRIELQIGMKNFGTGMTKEDVIKNLNMELAAGTGPDLLILDGLPVDSYIQQGILEDISPIVNRVDEEDGLVQPVVKHYVEEDGSVYRIPLGFTINVMYGPEDILGEKESITLRELTDNMAAYYAEEENRPKEEQTDVVWWCVGLDSGGFSDFLSYMSPACAGAWVQEDGSLDEAALTEYLTCLKTLQDIGDYIYLDNPKYLEYRTLYPKASVTDWWLSMCDSKDSVIHRASSSGVTHMKKIIIPQRYEARMIPLINMGPGECGNLSEESGGAYVFMSVVQDNINDEQRKKELDGKVCEGKIFDGQTQHTFNPKKTIGIVENSKNRKEAEAFLEYLLSDGEAPKQHAVAFSVNQTVMNQNFEENVRVELPLVTYDASEYIEWARKIISELEQPSPDYSVLLDAVTEEGCRYLLEDCTVEEAVEQIKKRMELYMAE